MSIQARLSKLEKRYSFEATCCQPCAEPALVCLYSQDDPNGELVPTGETLPGPCTACGRPSGFIELIEIVVTSTEK